MLIGVVSDTHNNKNNISKAISLFKEKEVELVVHTGDITTSKSLRMFSELNCNLVGVYGNNDRNEKGLQEAVSENNFLGKGVKLSTGLRVSEERLRGNFTVTNPNFNYSDKALTTDIFLTDIDKLTDSGYESTNAGFSLGTSFEQYDDLFFSPTFRTVYEELSLIHI